MNPRHALLIISATSVLSFFSFSAFAQNVEIERLSGFAKHQKDDDQFEKARERGERAYLEEEEQWENKKQRELQEYKRQSKARIMKDDGPEFREDAAQKKKQEIEYEKEKAVYARERAQKKSFDRQALKLPSEMQELGLDQERPRYDYRKRASFGATPKYGKNTPSTGSGSSPGNFGGGNSFGGSHNNSFPPPPTFDDFQDGGYLPAPTLNDDFMGDIPPPPPPPPPFGGDGGISGEGGYFPPPPPPPTFGDDSGDF